MSIAANTFDSDTDINIKISDFIGKPSVFDSGIMYLFENITRIQDVFVVYPNNNFEVEFSGNDLTKLAMELSESSFNELWDEEDDEYWNSY